jgi:signal transduction histidine kinase
MGLASLADRVRALGGEITINSRKGHGTQFRLSLPLAAGASIRTEPFPAAARNIA